MIKSNDLIILFLIDLIELQSQASYEKQIHI